MKTTSCLFFAVMVSSFGAWAQSVIAVRGNQVDIVGDLNKELVVGQRYYIKNASGKKTAIVIIDSSPGQNQYKGRVLRGKTEAGESVIPNNGGTANTSKTSSAPGLEALSYSGSIFLVSASGTATANLTVLGVTQSVTGSTSGTGFCLAPDLMYNFKEFYALGDLHYSSINYSGGSNTGYDLGVGAGKFFPEYKIKAFGYYSFLANISGSGTTMNGSGLTLGGSYIFMKNWAGTFEYRMMNYSGGGVKLSVSMLDFGATYLF